MSKTRRLGRGLGALIQAADTTEVHKREDNKHEETAAGRFEIEISKIVENRYQPRVVFEETAITELAASIKAQGLLQPLVVNDREDGSYELISGERRLRAIRSLGWKAAPVMVMKVDEVALLEMTLVENLQRENLNPVEEAAGYSQLIEKFGLTQEQVASRVGKDRATVANAVRLLKLPGAILDEISRGALSAGHARQLLAVDDKKYQLKLMRSIIEQQLSVRQVEQLVREYKNGGKSGSEAKREAAATPEKSAVVLDLEDKCRKYLGTKVSIRELKGEKGKGKIEIEYYSYEDFERLMELLNIPLA